MSHNIYFWFTIVTIAPLFVACFTIGTTIFWLSPHDRMAFLTSVFLITYGAASSFTPATEYRALIAEAPVTFVAPYFMAGILLYGLLAVFFATFPDGKFVPKWMGWIALEGFLFALAWELFPEIVGDFSGRFGITSLSAALVALGGSVIGQVWRYRNYATLMQKQLWGRPDTSTLLLKQIRAVQSPLTSIF